MDTQKKQAFSGCAAVGRILLENGIPCLEAFSGNAIYFRRGMPTMKNLKTVKQVCTLTGLTRKHLYYFHHEKIVPAVAYANYSVEGNDGYKLYDDAAVEKLQQIALYYQLGLRRDEIREIMQDPNYDSNQVLRNLLALEREREIHIRRRIAALEYLTLTGTKNGMTGALRGLPLEELGRILLAVGQAQLRDQVTEPVTVMIRTLSRLDERETEEAVRRIFEQREAPLKPEEISFLLGLLVSVLGDGSAARELAQGLTPERAKVVLRYLLDHLPIDPGTTLPLGSAEIIRRK